MSGLIFEIQRAALDPSVRIEDLLRRVKLAAAKLELGELEAWVDSELNSYTIGSVPEYRQLSGRPMALNPYNGWIPIVCQDQRLMEVITRAPIGQSIASIREMLNRKQKGGIFEFPLPPAIIRVINEGLNVQFGQMSIHVGLAGFVQIIDTVRNKALDWSIAMEKRGIVGEGLSFGLDEQRKAQAAMTTFNIGSIGSFAGNLGSGNQARDIRMEISVLDSIRETSAKIRSNLAALEASGADRASIEHALDKVDVEVAKPAPDTSKLRGLLTDIRAAASGAAGSLLAEGVTGLVDKLLSILS